MAQPTAQQIADQIVIDIGLIDHNSGAINNSQITLALASALTTTVYNDIYGTIANNANWDTAYGWGDHSVAGYITNLVGLDTDDLTEGTVNLYYTTTRANTDIDARVTKAFVDALNVDADTLDGIDSAGFALSGHNHDAAYLGINDSAVAANNLNATDDRDIKPNVAHDTNRRTVKSYFTSLAGLTGTADSNYQDLLVLDTWLDGSGGDINALAFDKSLMEIRHYQAAITDTTWGTPEIIAYQSYVDTGLAGKADTSHTHVIANITDFPTNVSHFTNDSGYLTSETSHADVVVDGDFSANGIMVRTGAGVYSTITDSSTNWDTAYTHSQATHAPTNAEENQSAFSNVAVSGQTTVAADSKTDTLTLVAGTNITITTNATTDEITITGSGSSDTNDYVDSVSFNTLDGVLTLGRTGALADLTVDLDGRYLESETSHADVLVDGDFATAGLMATNGSGTYSIVTDNSSDWNTAFGWGNHASAGYLTSETSHADVVVDGDFTANGIMVRTGAGVYSTITDSSTNWDTAYTHSQAAHAPSGAEVNQNAFSNIAVSGQTTVAADTKTDTVTFVAGTNISITTNATTDEVTINATGAGSNNYVDGATFATGTGVLTLTRAGLSDVTVDLDGRYLESETSHADVLVDGDFVANGIMTRTASGVYSTITDNSGNWNTAYGWGDHSGLYEPTFTKNTGFNKNFGTAAGTVSEGNHNHTFDSLSNVTITTITSGEIPKWNGTAWVNNTLAEAGIAASGHDHSGVYEPVFTKNTGFNLNLGTTAGTVSEGNHNHTLDSLSNVTITTNSTGEILKWSGSAWINNTLAEAGIEPAFSKNTGFNLVLGTGAGQVAEGNHNHDTAYLGISAKAADSELIDGVNSGRIVYGDVDGFATTDGRVDLNTLVKTGHYWAGTGTSNNPTNNGALLHVSHDTSSTFAAQMYLDHVSTTSDLYVRTKDTNSWRSWQKVLTEGNFGKTEIDLLNIDADTLDGIEGANYARTDVAEVFNEHVKIADGRYLQLGTNSDARLWSSGINTYFDNINGGLLIRQQVTGVKGTLSSRNSIGEERTTLSWGGTDNSVSLRYEGALKLITTDTGVSVTGNVLATTFTGDGSALTNIDADTLGGVASSGYALSGHDHSGVYEPVFSKNTGFNLNLGTTAGTVSEGNHTHASYVNQNAFSNFAVATQTTVAADSVTDTVTFEAGSNVTITTNATTDTITFSATDTNDNNYLDGLSFNTGDGVLTATRNGLANLTVDLDGRYLTSETSHADVLVDGDFSANGIMTRTALGVYSTITDNSTNWDSAYTHSQSAHAPSGAEVNQNAFSNIAVATQTTIAADSATDTLTLVNGSNITITTNATTDEVTIAATDTNNYVSGLSFNTGDGVLTATRSGLGDLTVDLDGRYLTSETSHADVVVDGDFTANGIMTRTASGVYSTVTDNSANWNTAYGWGDHSGLYEATFSKNTGFNKNFGTTAGTVSEGNHNHDSDYLGITATAADSSKLGNVAAANYARTDTAETYSASQNLQDNELIRPEIKDYGITHTSHTPTGTTLTLDYTVAQSHKIDLESATGNVTLTLSNPPASGTYGEMKLIVQQDSTTARNLVFPASVDWAGGTAPTISTGADAIDIIHLFTIDGGTTWYGTFAQDMK